MNATVSGSLSALIVIISSLPAHFNIYFFFTLPVQVQIHLRETDRQTNRQRERDLGHRGQCNTKG